MRSMRTDGELHPDMSATAVLGMAAARAVPLRQAGLDCHVIRAPDGREGLG
jgi:hypothetical protein